MEMIENRQNKVDCSGICLCQIATYDRESQVPRGHWALHKFQERLLERNRFAVGQKRNTGVSHGFIFRPWPFL